MRYIHSDIITSNFVCIVKVRITPGNFVGYGIIRTDLGINLKECEIRSKFIEVDLVGIKAYDEEE